MKLLPALSLAVLGSLLGACGYNSVLGRADQGCYKYPTPDERVACEKKDKENFAAFEKYQQQEKTRAQQADAPAEPGLPKNTLCFKRPSSGETVCPN